MFRNMLVPVDLTDRNGSVIGTVGELGGALQSGVALLHVIETLEGPADELRDFYKELEERARQKLLEFAEPLESSGLAVEQSIKYGKRVPEIVAFADDHHHDLIVMRSHRLNRDNPGDGFLTISHQVAIAANIPVLILR